MDLKKWISNIYFRLTKGGNCIHDPVQSDIDLKYETGVVVMETKYIIYIHFAYFSLILHSPTMTFRHRSWPYWLWAQGNQHNIYLRFLVAPVSLDLSTWLSRRQCWLRFSRISAVTSVGAPETFYLPITTLFLPLRMMNILLCFPGRVRFSSSTGNASLMP